MAAPRLVLDWITGRKFVYWGMGARVLGAISEFYYTSEMFHDWIFNFIFIVNIVKDEPISPTPFAHLHPKSMTNSNPNVT